MISPLAASVRDTIQRHKMLHAGDCLAVAVSGGADSVALLRLLEELRGDLGATLCVIHFNHQLRSADSDADENFVGALARQQGLAFIVGCDDVAAAAERHGWNLEDAARRLRYDFFAKIVADSGATRVATAHTADDQAETVLARLIRGTGLTGLGSIYPVRGNIIRPLLEVRRADLRAYLATIHQEWREDATNADTRRLRARVRQRLLPEVEENFSRSIVSKLSQLASLARDDERFWAALVEERCNGIVARTGETLSVHARELLWPLGRTPGAENQAQNPFRALTQRIVRRLYADVAASGGELSRKHVEQVMQLAEKGLSGRRIELPSGVRVRKEFDRLVFTSAGAERAARTTHLQNTSYAYGVDLPSRGSAAVTVPELGRCFHLKVIDWPMRERETRREGVVLDAERLRPPLVLRSWKPGDAYCPRGRRHSRKLARMMMAGRISAAQRALWPVLTSAGRVAWADRMPVAEEFSASEATRTGVWIVEDGR
ncbi:MAG: tRNA lysidine(34) synthetase TilS [Candidatus Acidiferrales bacterium]